MARQTPVHARQRLLVAIALVLFGVTVPAVVAQAIVPERPERDTPIVLDGDVLSVDQVGQTILVGGNFTQVQTFRGGPVVSQPGLFAYDADTGVFNADFRPIITNGGSTVEIQDIEPGPDGRSVYIGGRFTRINDRSDDVDRFRGRLAKIDVITGELDRTFDEGFPGGAAATLDYSNGWLYVGGGFFTVADRSGGATVNRPVRGLARFDADTGAYDTGFRYETRNDIGREFNGVRNHGVSTLQVTPNGRRLVVAHRGAEMRDMARGSSVQAGGVAIISLSANAQTHSLLNFQALYPDPNDPIQEYWHAEQCNGRGTQIKDMEISPDGSYFVAVSQGADLGFQCDSITRFAITTSPTRPTWVSRGFDSIFSVAIDNDYIYVGGHQRYMVHPSAPSAFPGDNGPNGSQPPRGQWYIADPNDPRPAGVAFREDLVDPGFVYPVNQLGALTPSTGKGITSWNPGSNAAVGVLELTLTDRGLLLGQDNGRVNGINTGRSAFFDDSPGSGAVTCSASLNASGRPVVTWNNTGSVEEFDIFRAGSQFDSSTTSPYVDSTSAAGQYFYELRFVRNSQALTAPCGTVTIAGNPPSPLTCSVAGVNGDQVRVSWSSGDWSRIAVRKDGGFVRSVFNGLSSIEDPGPGTHNYMLRGFIGGTRFDADCGSITVGGGANGCTASVNGNIVTLDWDDAGASKYQIRRDDRWRATVTNALTYSEPFAGGSYVLRYRSGGSTINVPCT